MAFKDITSGTNQCASVKDAPHGSAKLSKDSAYSANVSSSDELGNCSWSGPEQKAVGTPFERWRPQGGGNDQDIFRRFNIPRAEEGDFLLHWSKTRLASGFCARDPDGTLVFRISPTNLTDLNELGIGNLQGWTSCARWLHVYDRDGMSWLTRFGRTEGKESPHASDDSGRMVQHGGRLGSHASSRSAATAVVARRRIEAELQRMVG